MIYAKSEWGCLFDYGVVIVIVCSLIKASFVITFGSDFL